VALREACTRTRSALHRVPRRRPELFLVHPPARHPGAGPIWRTEMRVRWLRWTVGLYVNPELASTELTTS